MNVRKKRYDFGVTECQWLEPVKKKDNWQKIL